MIIKLASKPTSDAAEALGIHAGALYATPGKRIVVICELASVERTEVAPDEDGKPSVKLQIKELEVASDKQEDAVRQAMKALHTTRTAFGTLTEDLDVDMSKSTLDACGNQLAMIEATRLHIVVDNLADYAGRAGRNSKNTAADLRRELANVSRALHTALTKDPELILAPTMLPVDPRDPFDPDDD